MTKKMVMPWEDRPAGCADVMWRYSKNPVIDRYHIPSSNSIFNSAVVPFEDGFAGVFRCDNKAVQMNIFAGFSKDGIHWDIEHDPIKFKAGNTDMIESEYKYDPRVTWIEDRYWITWCNGYYGPTIGVGYTFDFKEFFQCENALLPFNRNGVLFPQKINGKYALLSRPSDSGHTPFGDIYISYSPDMKFWGEHRHVLSPTPFPVSAWQCTKVGAGPIPILTDEGWLMFYHGVITTCNGFRYSMGAAILDIRNLIVAGIIMTVSSATLSADEPVAYVNPFIGTTNFGTTNPGAICPNGLMSVTPFNVMGSNKNVYDKDARWWSTPYEYHNTFFTGFSHVNLSGVGCPELGSLLLMPTSGELNVDYKQYGSEYALEEAHPGYYANRLTRYGIDTEVSATPRTSIARFTYPGGESHILLNLGEGLTNESGATVRKVSDTEYEGSKLLGGFCYYNRQGVFPIYFVIRVDKKPLQSGYWKKQRPMTGVEAEWDPDNGKYKIYTRYTKEMSGDDIGVFFSYDTKPGEQIQVQMGVSFVSIENARQNLDSEQQGFQFDKVCLDARNQWNDILSRIEVEGGSDEQKTIFYTALYHMFIHPNILQDVNGQYPAMESDKILTTRHDRYTVFSLWDTFRNVHPFFTLAYPQKQLDMVQTLIDMYKEWGWLPRWELYGNETLTMSGDPAIIMLADTWLRGLKNFDAETAYEAMVKSATAPSSENILRTDNDDYMKLGYVPLREQFDNSVSHALEYYLADFALSRFAENLGHKEDAQTFAKRSLGYKHYYCKEFGTLRPILPDGSDSLVNSLLKKYFKNQPDGIPGNDDTGTMSAWAVFSMMGLYPDCPGIPRYTLVAPIFDKIILHLDPRYYTQDTLVIECERPSPKAIYTDRITVNGKKHKGRFIFHEDLVNAGTIRFTLTEKK